MSRELASQEAQHDSAERDASGIAEQDSALPPQVRARALHLGPMDAEALRALLQAYPGLRVGILEIAARQMGNAAVQRALNAPTVASEPETPVADDAARDPNWKPPIPYEELASTLDFGESPDDVKKYGKKAAESATTSSATTAETDTDTPGGGGSLSEAEIASAKRYNDRHSKYVTQFNEATQGACLASDGSLDPQLVWTWQAEHGIKHDGKVGPETATTAASAAKGKAKPEDTSKAKQDDHAEKAEHEAEEKKAKVEEAKPEEAKAKPEEAKPKVEEAKAKPEEAKAEEAKPRVDDGGPGSRARKIIANMGNADDAFKELVDPSDAKLEANLADYGSVDEQNELLDAVIVMGRDAIRVQRAFHGYWNVKVTSAAAAAATTNGGDNGAPSPAVAARDWPIPTLQAIHKQLKVIPDQDTRSGVWNKLSLTNHPSLINRAAYGGGDFIVGSNASTTFAMTGGYFVGLTDDAGKGASKLEVTEGPRFKVGDELVLDRNGRNQESVTVTGIKGNEYTLGMALKRDHQMGETLDSADGSGKRKINWLDATVRHEIAHSLDGGGCDTKGFYDKGGWVLGNADEAGFDAWVDAMGGEAAWTPSSGPPISATDRSDIKARLIAAVRDPQGSIFKQLKSVPDHPIMRYQHKSVPVIVAAEQCLNLGDYFYSQPDKLYAASGKRFSISRWYKRFQHHNESVVSERVADYGLYAPTEFFAEAYTAFYEEAGRDGVKDADYGRLIRNADWRDWLRQNVHNRGHAPAGTGAAKDPAQAPGESEVAEAETAEMGAQPGGASTGRASGNPGM